MTDRNSEAMNDLVQRLTASMVPHPMYASGWNACLDACAPEIERMRSEVAANKYVPGTWCCPKCKFVLIQSNLNADTGTVTARDDPGTKCPNCHTPLWRTTWRDEAIEMGKRCEEQVLRAVKAEAELAALRMQYDDMKGAMLDEIAANLAFREAGGALPDEDMPTFCARLISELAALRGRVEGAEASGVFVDRARDLAHRAHAGQVDKAGRPYIDHVARVAAAVSDDPIAEAVGWVHDVMEDHPHYTAQMMDRLPAAVYCAANLLDRNLAVGPLGYYERIRANPIALRVKLADIADNADESRLALLDEKTATRLRAKYADARRQLVVEG